MTTAMESELTPQVEKLIEKINAIPDKDKVFYGYYDGAYDHELIDLCSGSELQALAARDKGEGAKGRPVPVVDKWTRDAQKLIREAADLLRKERNPAVEILSLQSQLTTALERVRGAEIDRDHWYKMALDEHVREDCEYCNQPEE